MDCLPAFKNLDSIPELLKCLLDTGLPHTYYLIDRLIRLVLTLPVSTETTECAFSSMRLIKNRLRNKIEASSAGRRAPPSRGTRLRCEPWVRVDGDSRACRVVRLENEVELVPSF